MGLPNLNKLDNLIYKGCQMEQIKVPHKKLTQIGTSKPLELLHIDLARPTRTKSLGEKTYFFVIVDDFSRYMWVIFLREKLDAFAEFINICKRMKIEKDISIKKIRSDHGGEFENHKFSSWCDKISIKHEFSAPMTPQQNGVTERKNRTLLNMATCMLIFKNVAKILWAEAIDTTCYVSNRVLIRTGTSKMAYELWYGKKPNAKYFKVFGSVCYVLRDERV